MSVGVSSNTVLETLEGGLRQLTRAPLKPQQRMFILRCNLLPSLLHQAVLGRISRKTLKYMDTCTRAAVRSWLRLPRDTPTPYFHADYRDGGLAVAKLNLVIPLHRTKRMARLTGSLDPIVRGVSALPAFVRDVRRWSAPISAYGCPMRDGVSMRNALAHGLHTSVDGRGLGDSRSVGFVNRWMVNGTSLMSGRSFINCVRMKGNFIHTALRASRGRPQASTRCDACTATESLGHILQVCRRTHDSRVARHDGVNALLSSKLSAKGYATAVEPAIPTPAGLRYPDLVVHNRDACVVIDTTIIADNHSLDAAHQRKVDYYNQPAIREWCQEHSQMPAGNIQFSACVINWRGTIAPRSARELSALGLTQNELMLMCVRTLEMGHKVVRHFQRSTATGSGV